jgi:hypothetical protein
MIIVCRALLDGPEERPGDRWLYYLREDGFLLVLWSESGRML